MHRVKGKGPIKAKHKSFSSQKNVNSAVDITVEILALVNTFAIVPLTAEEIFVGKQLLCHNGVDRDRERFPESLIDDFANTLPGKSVLYFHNRNSYLPLGLYFDTLTEEMSAKKFKQLTGEDPRLPEGITNVKAMWAWYYVIKTDDIESVLKNITGGVNRHWSIGFIAADCDAVKKEANGPTLYWEYVGPGEATEGSLVWLGAQQGATSQKSFDNPDHIEEPDTGGNNTMKKIIAFLNPKLGKSFSDDTSEDLIVSSVKEALEANETEITTLKTEVKGLKSLADVGKSFQGTLVNDYARMKAALGEGDTEDTAHTKLKEFGKSLNIDQLQQEVKHLQVRMEKAFPDGQLDGEDPDKNRSDGKGKKNPLVPEDD